MNFDKEDSHSLSIDDLENFNLDNQDCKKLIDVLMKDSQFKKALKKSILEVLKPVYAKLKNGLSESLENKLKPIKAHDCNDLVEASLREFITEFDQYYQKDQKAILTRIKRLEESITRIKERNTGKVGIVKEAPKQKKRDVSTKSVKMPPKAQKKDNSASFSVSKFKANSSLISKSSAKKDRSRSTFERIRDKDKENKQSLGRVAQLETEIDRLKTRVCILEDMVKDYKVKDKDVEKKSINKSVFEILGSIKQLSHNNRTKSACSDIAQTKPSGKEVLNHKQKIKPAQMFKSKRDRKTIPENEFLLLDIDSPPSGKENRDANRKVKNLRETTVGDRGEDDKNDEFTIDNQSSMYVISREVSPRTNDESKLNRGRVICVSEEAND